MKKSIWQKIPTKILFNDKFVIARNLIGYQELFQPKYYIEEFPSVQLLTP